MHLEWTLNISQILLVSTVKTSCLEIKNVSAGKWEWSEMSFFQCYQVLAVREFFSNVSSPTLRGVSFSLEHRSKGSIRGSIFWWHRTTHHQNFQRVHECARTSSWSAFLCPGDFGVPQNYPFLSLGWKIRGKFCTWWFWISGFLWIQI